MDIVAGTVDELEVPVDETEEQLPPPLHEEEWAKNLVYIVDYFERQDQFFREQNLRKWKKGIYYWNNIQYIYWSSINHDYRTVNDAKREDPDGDLDPALYAKVINIVKPHGEAIIAAMSSAMPTVKFFPDDADEHNDVLTAKAYSKIADIIQRQNKSIILMMKALFILYNQGVVFAYNENIQDRKFGVIEEPEYETETIINRTTYCEQCGAPFGQSEIDDPSTPAGDMQCPACDYYGPAGMEDAPEEIQVINKYKEIEKTREIITMWGPLNVKTPGWISDLESTPYLTLETDEHFANLQETYPEIAKDIVPYGVSITNETEMRTPTNYGHDIPADRSKLRRTWLRPWAFNVLSQRGEAGPDAAAELKKKFPTGCYCVIINNDLIVEAIPDELDRHWTATMNPLAESLYAEPIVTALLPIQEMTNELANLTLENIEFSIPETFADPEVVDFGAYASSEARPGQMSPAKAPSGMNLSAGFYEIKGATLSQEVGIFSERLEKFGQFCVGSFPSIYGGTLEGGGGTAREYEQSRSQALQRLSTTWTMLKFFWADVLTKAVPSYAENMVADENEVQARGSAFVNVWVRKIDLGGKVGRIEPEVSEAFPMSWSQKRDTILNLIQLKDENIAAVIAHPENAGLVASIIGVPEMYIPGDDDRNKQLYEISKLITSEPLGPMMSSVPVDQILDNHQVESETCKAWLKSEVGLEMKETNPIAYANVLFHMIEHDKFVQQAAMAEQQAEEQDNENSQSNLS